MKEIWRAIENYDDYQVSNLGRVKSLKKGNERILKPGVAGIGYLFVVLFKDGKRKEMLIHRLVANAFIQNQDNLPCVNHKDENKQNNLVTNLEWCDVKYNSNYGTRNQRLIAKLSKKIGQFTKDGKLIKVWPSIIEAERQGFNHGNICSCCQGRLKSHAGFIWKYIKN